jgi:hypothetical protein
MSARELAEWAAFEHDFGPLTVQERVDVAGAVAAFGAVVAAGGGKKATPEFFLPEWSKAAGAAKQRRATQSDDELINFMRGLQSRGKRRRRKRKDA